MAKDMWELQEENVPTPVPEPLTRPPNGWLRCQVEEALDGLDGIGMSHTAKRKAKAMLLQSIIHADPSQCTIDRHRSFTDMFVS
jgi:hypothetical protein